MTDDYRPDPGHGPEHQAVQLLVAERGIHLSRKITPSRGRGIVVAEGDMESEGTFPHYFTAKAPGKGMDNAIHYP